MRVSHTPELNEPPPPPYSAQNPVPQDAIDLPIRTSLRGGYLRHGPRSQVSDVSEASTAATYFEDRPFVCTTDSQNTGANLDPIEHTIPFIPGAGREQIVFPQPAEAFFERDVSYEDWATFRNFLFPPHEQVTKGEKSAGGRGGDAHDFSKQDTPEHRARLTTVVAEWNQGFFKPRGIQILADFEPIPYLTISGSSSAPQQLSHEVPMATETSNMPGSAREAPYFAPLPSHSTKKHGHRRTSSISSTSSSSSMSSNSSVSSIKSKDLEGCTPTSIQSGLAAFRANSTNMNNVRHALSQLLEAFRAESQAASKAERKDMKKRYKTDYKQAKKEIKSVLKDAKKSRKAERKALRRERHKHRDAQRAEWRNFKKMNKHCSHAERRLAWAEARTHGVLQEGSSHSRAQAWGWDQAAAERDAEFAGRAHAAASSSGRSRDDLRREGTRQAEQQTGVIAVNAGGKD